MEAIRVTWTDDRLDGLSERMDERFDGVNERFDRVGGGLIAALAAALVALITTQL